MSSGEADAVLLELLEHLSLFDYRFVTPTPETHRRVVSRESKATARDLRDIFGWNLPFPRASLPSPLFDRLSSLGLLSEEAGRYKSHVRVSSIGDRLFLHSAYPTLDRDAVFFGPDTYRFVAFLGAEIRGGPAVRRLVDIGAGAGAGAIAAAASLPGARLTLADVNPLALRYARINARHASLGIELVEGSGIERVTGPFDLAVANPPFIADAARRTYRDGGGMHGAAVSLEWALAAARRVTPGGRVLLYTGSAIVAGTDRLEAALRARLPADCTLRYAELDPDIFSEELDLPGYEEVERIAAVGAVITKAAAG